MRRHGRLLTVLMGIMSLVLMLTLRAESNENIPEAELKIKHLQKIIPHAPAVIHQEALELMHQVAKTKRLDAALLLIQCLVFNFEPTSSDNERSQDMMIPAIQLLKDHFGEAIAPLLYTEAIATDQKWFRDRIALATRIILSPQMIKKMNDIFSLDLALNPNAKDFTASLVAVKLDIRLAMPDEETITQVDDAIKKIREKKQVK